MKAASEMIVLHVVVVFEERGCQSCPEEHGGFAPAPETSIRSLPDTCG